MTNGRSWQVIGPCPHGRDPWTRCEVCSEGDVCGEWKKYAAGFQRAFNQASEQLTEARERFEAERKAHAETWAKLNQYRINCKEV